jgi:hypothetical protein
MKHSWLDEHRQFQSQNRYAAAIVFGILDRLLTINSVPGSGMRYRRVDGGGFSKARTQCIGS